MQFSPLQKNSMCFTSMLNHLQIRRFESMILAERRHYVMSFLVVYIWCLMNTSNCLVRLLKQLVSVVTSTWWRTVVKILSICVCDFIRSMLIELTRCCLVLELIGKIFILNLCRPWAWSRGAIAQQVQNASWMRIHLICSQFMCFNA